MKKVIRLTESDLVRIVKRVINEQEIPTREGLQQMLKDKGFTERPKNVFTKTNKDGEQFIFKFNSGVIGFYVNNPRPETIKKYKLIKNVNNTGYHGDMDTESYGGSQLQTTFGKVNNLFIK